MELLRSGSRASLIVVAVIAAGCGSSRGQLRYGSLAIGDRWLDYKPGIEWWTLPNHLTVAIAPDDRANLVSVDVRYLVGAAEDPPGKTGLAHLVEHMMFELRSAPKGPTLQDRLAVVALGHNAFTTSDATHYFEVGLATSLNELLAVEALRMGLGCRGLDQATFERERAVVVEELAQRGQRGKLEFRAALQRELFGTAHAYAHTAAGGDVAGLTLDDVCAFVDAYYAPANAILVAGGRVDPVALRRAIASRFGAISRPAQGPRAEVTPVAWTGAASSLHADIDEPIAMVAFPAAPWGSAEALQDQLLDGLVMQRLRELARKERWITDLESGHVGGERGGARYFALQVADPKRLDDAVARIYRAATKLPGADDDGLLAVLGAERQDELLDGFESIAQRGRWCADYLQFTAHHEFQLHELRELQSLDLQGLRLRAQRLVPGASRVVRVLPIHEHTGAARLQLGASEKIDLPVWRAEVDPAQAERPLTLSTERRAQPVTELRLPNGLRVLMVSDFTQPVVEARMVFPVGEVGGSSNKRGLARAAADLLKHDVKRRYELKEQLVLQWVLRLGAQLSPEVSEHTTFQVRGFSLFADWHLWRLYWLLENGRYDDEDLTRLADDAARIEKHRDPKRMWRRALRESLFGRDHPYARATTAADLAALTGDELAEFRDAYYRAPGATLIIVGNFNATAMTRTVTELFGAWPATPPPALAAVPPMRPAAGPTWITHVDRDAAQVRVTYAFAATSPRTTSLGPRAVVSELVRARLEQVRTRLGASYGVDAGYEISDAGDVIEVDGLVDAGRAGEVLRQMQADLAGLRAGDTALAADFVRARRAALAAALADPIRSSTAADQLEAAVANHLPLDTSSTLPAAIATTTLATARAVIEQDLQPARMVVVLSGRPADTDAALAAIGVTEAQRVTEQATR